MAKTSLVDKHIVPLRSMAEKPLPARSTSKTQDNACTVVRAFTVLLCSATDTSTSGFGCTTLVCAAACVVNLNRSDAISRKLSVFGPFVEIVTALLCSTRGKWNNKKKLFLYSTTPSSTED